MSRSRPTSEDIKRIALLREQVFRYIKENWDAEWHYHGDAFRGMQDIYNKNRFYESILQKIEEKIVAKYGLQEAESRMISKDSVRRFLLDEVKRNDPKVLNAFLLLIGSEADWSNFNQTIRDRTTTDSIPNKASIPDRKRNTDNIQLYKIANAVLSLSLVVILGWFIYEKYLKKRSNIPIMELSTSDDKNFPKKINVDFDLSECQYKSASVNYLDGNINLNEVKGDTAFRVNFPSLVNIKLHLDGEPVKTNSIFIESDGWFGSISNKFPLNKSAFMTDDGVMHIINYKEVPDFGKEELYSSFMYVKEFGIDGAECELEADVLNSEALGGTWAYDVSVDLIGKDGKIVFNLLDPKATVYAQAIAGKTNFRKGINAGDLHKLGVDLSHWRHLKVITHHNRLRILLDGETLIDDAYKGKIGDLYTVQFYLKGMGYVKNVTLNGQPLR